MNEVPLKRDVFWLRIIYIVSVVISLAVGFLILGPRPDGMEGVLDVSALPLVNALLNTTSTLLLLLALWFLVSFGMAILFVDILDSIHFFGFKLGFWFSQQGAIYTFVALIFVYVFKMNTLDKKYGVDE